MLVLSPVREGREGEFLQVVKVNTNKPTLPSEVLSLGTFTVNQILAWDGGKNTV